jgi:hypothetical protein
MSELRLEVCTLAPFAVPGALRSFGQPPAWLWVGVLAFRRVVLQSVRKIRRLVEDGTTNSRQGPAHPLKHMVTIVCGRLARVVHRAVPKLSDLGGVGDQVLHLFAAEGGSHGEGDFVVAPPRPRPEIICCEQRKGRSVAGVVCRPQRSVDAHAVQLRIPRTLHRLLP